MSDEVLEVPDSENLDPFDPFSAAEIAAQSVLEQVLQEGGKLLYDSYIERKSFSFAANAACEVLVGEMKMCFVRHDAGEERLPSKRGTPQTPQANAKADLTRPHSTEASIGSTRGPLESTPRPGSAPAVAERFTPSPTGLAAVDRKRETEEAISGTTEGVLPDEKLAPRDGWLLESEPPRSRIDTWARACVPIRKVLRKAEHRKSAVPVKRSGSRASVGSVSVPGSRSPSRFGVHTLAESSKEAEVQKPTRNQQIPLVDEREEDEEEAMLRELKEREARKMRDDQVRTERKAAEAEEAKMAQIKDDKKKQYAYDSDGNVILVQPMQVHRLPNPNPAPTFICKQEEQSQEQKLPEKKPARREKGRKRENSVEFKDGFKKFLSQQPSMMEAMMMSAGVELEENHKTKKGEKAKSNKPSTMSRKEYEEMTKGSLPSQAAPTPPKASPPPRKVSHVEVAPGPASKDVQASTDKEPMSPGQSEAKGLRSEAGGAVKVPKAPDAPRPIQPTPPSGKRVPTKRDGLGYVLSTRERPRINAGSRFPGCAAQPPLGATMGHGLAPSPRKYEEYYFPSATSHLAVDDEEAELASPRKVEGQIVSKNPQLKTRLFGRA